MTANCTVDAESASDKVGACKNGGNLHGGGHGLKRADSSVPPGGSGGGEVLGASVSAALLAYLALPDQRRTRFEASFYPAMGFVGGAVIAFLLIIAINLVLAPYRQRNEAREEVGNLQAEIDKLKAEPPYPVVELLKAVEYPERDPIFPDQMARVYSQTKADSNPALASPGAQLSVPMLTTFRFNRPMSIRLQVVAFHISRSSIVCMTTSSPIPPPSP